MKIKNTLLKRAWMKYLYGLKTNRGKLKGIRKMQLDMDIASFKDHVKIYWGNK